MTRLRVRFVVARHELLHKLPFIPEAWLNWACDRYDARLSPKSATQ